MNRVTRATSPAAIAIVLAACSENSLSGPGDNPIVNAPSGMVVSNALTPRVTSSTTDTTGSLSSQSTTVAYLSAEPGTFPDAVSVTVSNKTRPAAAQKTTVIAGGFDPIVVEAQSGDELSLTFSLAAGGISVMSVKVPARRPPGVVRTSPPKGRTDVALNSYMVVIFSEPIEASSVTSSSLTLTHDGIPVNGRIQVTTDRLNAEFIPDNPLEPQTTYELRIGGGIRDLDGDALGETPVVTFTTSVSAATAGAIEVSVSTTGPDQDADGYLLSAQAPSSHQWTRLAVTGTQTITGTEPGEVRLLLYGLASNCTYSGPNPQAVNVKAGVTATVSFVVNCVASGSLRVTTATTGGDPDIDGYVMVDRNRSTIGSDLSHSFTAGLDIVLPPNGTTTASALIPGNYQVDIRNVAPNCDASIAAPESITIVAGVETSLTLGFTCVAPTQIAFVRGAGREDWNEANIANTDIYLINSNGTRTVRLTSQAGADINPAWSPDGQKIAFASDRAGNREIYVMNADGTDPVRLTNHVAADYRPAYSPDGKRIAFVSERDGNAEIYLMNVDGTNVSRLTTNPGSDTEPAWSPDGSRIAFRSNDNIYVMNADGSGTTRLTTSADLQPAWAPDGKTIAFRRDRSDGDHSIYLMNADGSQIRRFLGGAYDRSNPDWSPDGRKIAFDDRDCWDSGPCPRGIVIGTIDEQYSIVLDDAAEPAWRPR